MVHSISEGNSLKQNFGAGHQNRNGAERYLARSARDENRIGGARLFNWFFQERKYISADNCTNLNNHPLTRKNLHSWWLNIGESF